MTDHPISLVLGGHIEIDSEGKMFPWQSQYHPHEHALQMTKNDLLALPVALRSFNGFYTTTGKFILMNSIHILIAEAILVGAVLAAVVCMLVRYIRRRKRTRAHDEELTSGIPACGGETAGSRCAQRVHAQAVAGVGLDESRRQAAAGAG